MRRMLYRLSDAGNALPDGAVRAAALFFLGPAEPDFREQRSLAPIANVGEILTSGKMASRASRWDRSSETMRQG
jgi:hypothetical protein